MIVTAGTGKALQINLPASGGQYRYLWVDGLDTAWAGRTAGNNILQIEFDYFTGAASTSQNVGGVEFIDTTNSAYGGIVVHAATKTVYGEYYDDTSATPGTTYTNLGAGTANVTLPANTWVRMGFAYNSTNGTITFKGPGFSKTVTATGIMSPTEIDYSAYDGGGTATPNTAASTHQFDNMVAKAVSVESLLLATNEVSLQAAGIELYPNPATDFINVKSKTKILAAYIYDMAGIRMDAAIADGKVDVRNLKTGNYLLGMKTENGLVTAKFIKK